LPSDSGSGAVAQRITLDLKDAGAASDIRGLADIPYTTPATPFPTQKHPLGALAFCLIDPKT
jgi:hypothetical protein